MIRRKQKGVIRNNGAIVRVVPWSVATGGREGGRKGGGSIGFSVITIALNNAVQGMVVYSDTVVSTVDIDRSKPPGETGDRLDSDY